MRRGPAFVLLLTCLAGCGEGGPDAGALVGVYVLDREDLAATLLRERVEAMTPAARAALGAERRRALLVEARATAQVSDLRVDLLADGRFVVRFRYGAEEGRRLGTWRRDGAQVTLTTTHGAAGALAEPLVLSCRVEATGLRFARGVDVPHAFLLRRR